MSARQRLQLTLPTHKRHSIGQFHGAEPVIGAGVNERCRLAAGTGSCNGASLSRLNARSVYQTHLPPVRCLS